MTPEQRVEWEAEVRSLYHDVSAVAIAAVSVGSDSVRFAHGASVDQLRRREEHPRTPSRPRSC